MLVKRQDELKYSDVTPRSVYINRRKFLQGMTLAGAAAVAGTKILNLLSPGQIAYAGTKLNVSSKSPFSTTEPQTPYNDVTTYNNFYEFGTGKEDPAQNAKNFRTSPWTVSVEGEVKKPRKFTIDDILKLAPLEERI